MAKKKSCQNVRNPCVLSPVERELYGWVDAEVFTQSSVLASEHLPELRREMRLAQDLASESDYVLKATGLSDRLPFRALKDRTHFFVGLCRVVYAPGRPSSFFGLSEGGSDARIFLYTYQLHAPPPGNGFLSFRAYQVLPLPGTRPFWVDDEGKSYPWVYWNSGARECRITALDPLETLAFEFLQSLPVGLGKRSNFRCRLILDPGDAEVGAFLGGSSKDPAGKPFPVQGEEGAKEDPSADLKKKGRKRKAPGASAEEAALGADSSWVHKVSPINRAFPDEYNFREALDACLTNGPTREILGPLVPEQLLGTAQHLAYQLTACLQSLLQLLLVVFVFLDWGRESFCLQGSDREGASFSEGSSGRAYGGKGFGPGGSSSECRD
ncbi:hypothetical protein PIB30_051052 [Stylosanthes scabra]|uniref:Uncharacterized protein n=1 Tax=Stylosanthes scabra TaxID=79078 RepID=A0ABU6RHX4_9FABA|nr:hypothetical protein [Stylosanthes scabra]